MAISALIRQKGDKYNTTVYMLAAHNPLFWIIDVTSTTTLVNLYIIIKFTINAINYEFRAINLDFDGNSGEFLFDGTNIVNSFLNNPDDIIPTTSAELASEMYKSGTVSVYYNDGIGGSDTYLDSSNLIFINAARDIGNEWGATMDDWYACESKTFYSQSNKDTYWYFYNYSGAGANQFLEYVKIDSIPVVSTLIDNSIVITDNSEILTNTE